MVSLKNSNYLGYGGIHVHLSMAFFSKTYRYSSPVYFMNIFNSFVNELPASQMFTSFK